MRTRSLLQGTEVLVKALHDKQDMHMKLTRYECVAGKKRVEVMNREVSRKGKKVLNFLSKSMQ